MRRRYVLTISCRSTNPVLSTLQIQAFRLTLALSLEYPFSSSAEIIHVYPHSALSESQQPSLGADSLDIGTREVIFLIDELVKIDVFVERHLGCVEREDLFLGRLCDDVSV